jgi:hypothetical protein
MISFLLGKVFCLSQIPFLFRAHYVSVFLLCGKFLTSCVERVVNSRSFMSSEIGGMAFEQLTAGVVIWEED